MPESLRKALREDPRAEQLFPEGADLTLLTDGAESADPFAQDERPLADEHGRPMPMPEAILYMSNHPGAIPLGYHEQSRGSDNHCD